MKQAVKKIDKLIFDVDDSEVLHDELQELRRQLEEKSIQTLEISEMMPLFIYQVEAIAKITRMEPEDVVEKINSQNFTITEVRLIVHELIRNLEYHNER